MNILEKLEKHFAKTFVWLKYHVKTVVFTHFIKPIMYILTKEFSESTFTIWEHYLDRSRIRALRTKMN